MYVAVTDVHLRQPRERKNKTMDHSHLKGIINSNDDPNLCAICDVPLRRPRRAGPSTLALAWCCGSQFCNGCIDAGLTHSADAAGAAICSLCNEHWPGSSHAAVKVLKKNAKRGRPWAQFILALAAYVDDEPVVNSPYEAVRLHRKAAQQGHPGACLGLGSRLASGEGCVRDIAEALKFFEKAVELDASYADVVRNELIKFSQDCWKKGETEECISILRRLVDEGVDDARMVLGMIYLQVKDYQQAYGSLFAAALSGEMTVVSSLYVCSAALNKYPQTRICGSICCRHAEVLTSWMADERERNALLLRDALRSKMAKCGGCGASLDTTTRRTCKQCRAASYCSRQCQKLHWNRQGGHAADCKEAKALKEKFKNVSWKN